MIARPGRVAPFFWLTFAFTWGLQVPGVLAQRGLLPGNPNAYLPFAGLGIFGPCVAAIILSRRAGGAAAVKELIAPVLHGRGSLRWAVAAVLPAVLLTAALYALSFAGRRGPVTYDIPMFIGQGISLSLLPVMLLFFTGGSLLFAAIYNGTRGSLLVVILAHWCAHLNNSHRALPSDVVPLLAHTIIYAALGLFVMRRAIGQVRTKTTGSPQS